MLNIVLIEPRIPQNTGNIGRLCVALNANLHLVHPLGFSISQKELKRAGMDYWQSLNYFEWDNLDHFWQANPLDSNHFFLSTKANKIYFDANFKDNCFLYFGREDAGINEAILKNNMDKVFKIPMQNNARSLNLANSVAIVAYEALRQINFS